MGFSDRFRELRKKHNLSQEQIAVKLNVSRQAISKWETGAIPDVENLVNIARYFQCSLDYLMDMECREELQAVDNADVYNKQKLMKQVESFLLGISIIASVLMIVLWVTSKFVEVGFVRQDELGRWYTGFRGFVEQYRLYPMVFLLVLFWLISMNIRIILQIKRSISLSKRYVLYRMITWGMYMLAAIVWIIDFVDIGFLFVLTSDMVILLSVYFVILVILLLHLYVIERRMSPLNSDI